MHVHTSKIPQNVLGINGFNTLDCGDNWKKPDSEENQDSRTTFSCWWRNIYGAAICGVGIRTAI